MVPRVFARSSTIFRYSQREFRSCLYVHIQHTIHCILYRVYKLFLSRSLMKKKEQLHTPQYFVIIFDKSLLWSYAVKIMKKKNYIPISFFVSLYKIAIFSFNLILLNPTPHIPVNPYKGVTRNSRFCTSFIFSRFLRVRLFLTFRGTVYYPSGGTWYRDAEISSAPGLATRGASLFASANGKGFARAIPISRHFSMFSTIAAGQIKFSQFLREIEPRNARAHASTCAPATRHVVRRGMVDPR